MELRQLSLLREVHELFEELSESCRSSPEALSEAWLFFGFFGRMDFLVRAFDSNFL